MEEALTKLNAPDPHAESKKILSSIKQRIRKINSVASIKETVRFENLDVAKEVLISNVKISGSRRMQT